MCFLLVEVRRGNINNTRIGGVPPFVDDADVTGGTPIGRFVVGLEGTELLVTPLAGNGPREVGGEAGVIVVPDPEVFSVDPPLKKCKFQFL
jgi:hypothetical protein